MKKHDLPLEGIDMHNPKYTSTDRRLLFRRGFCDGAKGNAQNLASYEDYAIGYETGHLAYLNAWNNYAKAHDIEEGTYPLRTRSVTEALK